MRRRDVVAALGGIAAAPPFAALAQQRVTSPARVGALLGLAPDDPGQARNLAGLAAGMADAGWIDGKTVQYDFRYVPGGGAAFAPIAKELVASAPDALLAAIDPGAIALQRETRSIPIVFALGLDPVAEGLVASLTHPGANVTGFLQSDFAMGSKWVQLLKQIAPDVVRAAILGDPKGNACHDRIFPDDQSCRALVRNRDRRRAGSR